MLYLSIKCIVKLLISVINKIKLSYSLWEFLFVIKSFSEIIKIIKNRYIYLIIELLLFCIGIILSVCFRTEVQTSFFYDNVYNSYIVIFTPNTLIWGHLFTKLFFNFVLICFIVFAGLITWGSIIHFIFIIYQGFIFGIVFGIVIEIFGLTGIFINLVILLPSSILRLLSISLLSLLLFDLNTRKQHCKNHKKSRLLLYVLVSFMFCIIAFLWEGFLISLIVRPINIFL